MKEVLLLVGKLHHVVYVVRPGQYFVRRLLPLSELHLNGEKVATGGSAWGQTKKAEAEQVVGLTMEVLADVE